MIKITPITAYEIADFLGVQRPERDAIIKEISIDTREGFGENTCFIAIDGKRFSGNDFLNEAIEKGAKCIVSNLEKAAPVSFISTFDTKKAFLKLSSREIKNTKIIAVTGSVGKTTVKEMISSVLSSQFKVHSTFSNHNNEIGVAQTLFSINNEDFCVVEMGMRGLGEIEELAMVCEPFIGVITNCGTSHIELLGSKENIFRAKCELIKHTTYATIVPFEERFRKLQYGSLQSIFVGEGGNVELLRVTSDKKRIIADIIDNDRNKILTIQIPSFFYHDANNALFAYKVGKLCGVSDKNIINGIMEYKKCGGRGQKIEIGPFEVIDDTYNASFESVEQAIISLAKYSSSVGKKSVLIIGDMLEIGDFSREYHTKIGEIAKKYAIDELVSFGRFSSFVCDGFSGGIIADSLDDIVDIILNKTPKSSVLLVKASRSMGFEKIIDDLKEKIDED